MKRLKIMDVCKGVAICLVLVGHLIQNNIIDYENLFIFNIIWSIQIPLFFFVSGFFNNHAKLFERSKEKGFFKNVLTKKTKNLLVPFLSFFLLIKFLLLNEYDYNILLAIKTLCFKLEISLWFLYALFIIQVILILAVLLIRKNEWNQKFILPLFLFLIFLYCGICVLLGGTSFLGAKFIGYYSLFYIVGAISYRFNLIEYLKNNTILDLIIPIVMFVYLFILINVNLFLLKDDSIGILLRFISGLCGIILLIYYLHKVSFAFERAIILIGQHTLEIYATHLLFSHVVDFEVLPINEVNGILQVLINGVLMIIITYSLIKIVSKNKYLCLIFYGK